MLGAGITLLVFAFIMWRIGKGLEGSGGDAFAFVEFVPYFFGAVLGVLGVAFSIIGYFF